MAKTDTPGLWGGGQDQIHQLQNIIKHVVATYQGLSARARPNFGAALLAFESYSPEKVISDFGLHSRCHIKAAFPLLEKRVFTTVCGSIEWALPKVKLFSNVENLWVSSAATIVPLEDLTS